MPILEEMKLMLPNLIQYYYTMRGNKSGGNLHIVLDDGNTDYSFIRWCRDRAEKAGDNLTVLVADLMLKCTEKELETLHESGWKSFKTIKEVGWDEWTGHKDDMSDGPEN